MLAVFFFQAEDGIRDGHVTGVQTCALPIYRRPAALAGLRPARVLPAVDRRRHGAEALQDLVALCRDWPGRPDLGMVRDHAEPEPDSGAAAVHGCRAGSRPEHP